MVASSPRGFFCSIAGKDLIADSCAKPRPKAKPTFGANSHQAVPIFANHIASHHSPPNSTQTQQPLEGAAEQDPDEERRQSGQTASTSRSGDGQGHPEVFSSKSSSSGAFPTGPFASIGVRDGRRSSRSPNKTRTANQGPPAPAHSAPDSKPVTQHAGTNMHGHSKDVLVSSQGKQRRTHRRRHSSNHIGLVKQASRSGLPEEEAAAHAATDTEALHMLSHKEHGQQAQQCATGLNSRPARGTSLPDMAEPSSVTAAGGCKAEHGKAANVIPNAAAIIAEGQLPNNAEANMTALETDMHDSAAIRHSQRKRGSARQPGPSAFPQMPYERSLQLLESSNANLSGPSLAEPGSVSPVPELDTIQHTHAETDSMAAGMQSRLQQLQMQELRAEGEGQGAGPQHQMSQHGGYMQREGHERLPRRRTTRSMLRGADTQTGDSLLMLHLPA